MPHSEKRRNAPISHSTSLYIVIAWDVNSFFRILPFKRKKPGTATVFSRILTELRRSIENERRKIIKKEEIKDFLNRVGIVYYCECV